jgi:hypothetical protein
MAGHSDQDIVAVVSVNRIVVEPALVGRQNGRIGGPFRGEADIQILIGGHIGNGFQIAGIAHERIIAASAVQCIIPPASLNTVVSVTAVNAVIPFTGIEGIISSFAVDGVVPASATHGIAFVSTHEGIVPWPPFYYIAGPASLNRVVPRIPNASQRPSAAEYPVMVFIAIQQCRLNDPLRKFDDVVPFVAKNLDLANARVVKADGVAIQMKAELRPIVEASNLIGLVCAVDFQHAGAA